jgi:hypothetical protein
MWRAKEKFSSQGYQAQKRFDPSTAQKEKVNPIQKPFTIMISFSFYRNL